MFSRASPYIDFSWKIEKSSMKLVVLSTIQFSSTGYDVAFFNCTVILELTNLLMEFMLTGAW